MKSRITSILTSLLLCFGMGARADNVVTIGSASGAPDEEVTVSIALQNTDAVAAMQVLIPMDNELNYVDGSAALTSRCGSHSVTAGVKDGELSIMVYSYSMTAITGATGDVVSFQLRLGNQPKNITLAASKLILTDTSGNNVAGTVQNGTVSIRCAKAQYSSMTVDFGSVPIRSTYTRNLTVTNIGNEPLEVTGLQFSNYTSRFSSTTQFPLTVAAGSNRSINITYAPEERGAVSETVKVVCNSISKLNNITLTAAPFAVNELHMQPASGISDETVTVGMTMNNMDGISGFQFEFNLPDALEYVPNSFLLSNRKQDHTIVASETNGVLRIIGYSPSDKPFTGEDGELATMQFVLRGRNSVTLKASKCLLTATINNQVTNVCSADYGATITIRSPRINAASTLAMGATPVTENAVKTFSVRNNGSAPLVISRVVFDKEQFSVQESMPLTIQNGQTASLTIVYPSTVEGDYETSMQLYCNDPEQRVWNVNVTGNRFAPNYLAVTADDINRGSDLTVKVSLDNYDAINGIQFDMEYPSEWFEPTDGIVQTARAGGMNVSWRQLTANTVRYFFYSLSDEEIARGNGEVLSFTMAAKSAAVPEGSYTLKITNIKLGTADMVDKYAGQNLNSSFTVKPLLKGDVDGDGSVDIADAVIIVNHYVGKPVVKFIEEAADVDNDNSIDIADAVIIINYYVGKIQSLAPQRFREGLEPQ